MLFKKQSIVLLVAVLLFASSHLLGQTTAAEVNGVVLDTTGKTIQGAAVKVANQETNIVSAIQTNQDGTFTIVNLLPGTYVLTVEKSGFKTITPPVFTLDVNQIVTQKLTMQVGAMRETVMVTGQAMQLQTSSAELGTTVDPQTLAVPPMNGRLLA